MNCWNMKWNFFVQDSNFSEKSEENVSKVLWIYNIGDSIHVKEKG